MIQITSFSPIISANIYHLFSASTDRTTDCCFLFLLKGQMHLRWNGSFYTMQQGDILYLPSEAEYQIQPQETCYLLFIRFHPFFLLDALGFDYQSLSYYSGDYTSENNDLLSRYLANLAVACISTSLGHEIQMQAKAFELLSYLSYHAMLKPAGETPVSKSDLKLASFYSYLNQHYRIAVSLTEAAQALDYTPQYLASFLKKHTNMTFQECLNLYRLEAALLMIKFSSDNMHRIASYCGFPNTTSFLKLFDSMHQITPEEYRANFQSKTCFEAPAEFIPVTNATLCMDYIFNYMHYVSQDISLTEEYEYQSAKINCQKHNFLEFAWNHLINLGSIADFEKPEYRYSLTTMQKRLHFQYGRCIGLFHLAKAHTTSAGTSYDFSKIFMVTDFLRSIQLKPLFELSNKPFHIYKADEKTETDYRNFLEPEKYDVFFFQVFPEFIKACISRYGFDEFSSWKFELWLRYNPSMTSMEDFSSYCERFQKTARILKTLVPASTIGGPGFNTFLQTSYLNQILNAFSGKEFLPDFISVYYFPYLPNQSDNHSIPSGFTTAPTCRSMGQKITEVTECIKKLELSHIPLYITEFSSYLSSGNYINDSAYPAVYLLHQMVSISDYAASMGYWLASDISLSYGNYSSPFFGGNGILSKQAIAKPSFYAFDFLNQLGDHLIAKGEHFIVTGAKDLGLQILVFYQTNLNHTFSHSPFNQELLHYPYSAYEETPPLHLNLHLTHTTPGNYLIKEQSIGITHGNVLSAWGKLDYLKNIQSDEIEYLRHESVPSFQIKHEILGPEYLLEIKLRPNEAKLYLLEMNF